MLKDAQSILVKGGKNDRIILAIHVDDGIIIACNKTILEQFYIDLKPAMDKVVIYPELVNEIPWNGSHSRQRF